MTRIAFVVLAIAACVATTSGAGAGKKSDAKVKATAEASKPDKDGKQVVTIKLAVEKPWFIYANPVGHEDIADNRTLVTIKTAEKVKVDVKYPAGKDKTEGTTKYKIYEEAVTIEATVVRTPNDASPLQVSIEVNACLANNGRTVVCLPQGTIQLTVK